MNARHRHRFLAEIQSQSQIHYLYHGLVHISGLVKGPNRSQTSSICCSTFPLEIWSPFSSTVRRQSLSLLTSLKWIALRMLDIFFALSNLATKTYCASSSPSSAECGMASRKLVANGSKTGAARRHVAQALPSSATGVSEWYYSFFSSAAHQFPAMSRGR